MTTAFIPPRTYSVHDRSSTESIQVRQLQAIYGQDIPRFWFQHNPVLTCMLIGLSVSFPAGERYFIDSVRAFEDQVKDPDLRKAIKAFVGQEANHTREHRKANAFFASCGFSVEAMEAKIAERIRLVQAQGSAEENLARTAALEHFTAIMAKAFLDHPQELESMHPTMARLWIWHAIEEQEHKSVAFDVYQSQVGDEGLRRRIMLEVSFFFILLNTLRTLNLLQESGQLFNLGAWIRGMDLLWGRVGVFRKTIPSYLAYFRRGFHPVQIPDSPAERALAQLGKRI